MKELVLSLVISSLTIVTGYIVVKNTDVDILKYFQSKNNQPENSKKLKNTKKEMNDSLNNGKKDKDKIEATKKRISKTVKNFFQKIIKKDDNKKVQNRGTRKITAVASGKKGRLGKRGKKTNDLLRDFNKVLGIFNAGDIVEHSVFGKGKVLSLSGLESNESARVRFNKGVEMNLILKYANLRLVGH